MNPRAPAAFPFSPLLLFTLLALPLPAAAQGPGRLLQWAAAGELYDDDEILVDFQDSTTAEQVADFAKKHGLELKPNSIWSAGEVLTHAHVPAGTHPEDVLARLAGDPLIEFAERDALYSAAMVPDDPKYAAQWNLRLVDMERAWNLARGRKVVVAVIDTGVSRVPDLAGVEWVEGYDFVEDDADPSDRMGHGTHVAGTVAQQTNNRLGVAGVAFEARLMPLRVLDERGMGQTGDIADAIRWAADHGAHVINLSLGGGARSQILEDAVRYARNQGVLVVAAAGNDGAARVSYPAAYEGALGVAALDSAGEPAFYSNHGPAVALAAPGGDTRVDRNGDGLPDGVMQNTIVRGRPGEDDYPLYMGTSMASPHVAGAAALLIGDGVTDPGWVVWLLQSTAVAGKAGRDDHYGHGRVDPAAALVRGRLLRGPGPLVLAVVLALLVLRRLTRKDALDLRPATGPWFWAALVMGSSGLFFLPWVVGWPHPLLALLSEPVAGWGLVALGPSWHLTPLLGSALLPLGAVVLLASHRQGSRLAAGLAFGFAALLLWSTILGQADVTWIPGRLLDRVWLGVNGAFCLLLGQTVLRR